MVYSGKHAGNHVKYWRFKPGLVACQVNVQSYAISPALREKGLRTEYVLKKIPGKK